MSNTRRPRFPLREMVSAHRDAISPYNKQTVDVMIKHETEAQKNHHNPLHGITTRSDAAMWPLRLSLIQKKQHNPPGGCVNLSHSGARRWGWGEDLSHYAWCSLPLPAFLCNSTGRPSARERSGVSPPHRGFHLDPAVGKNQCGEKTLPTPDTTEILLDGVRYCENVG